MDRFGVEEIEIIDCARFVDDLGGDDIDMLEFIVDLEKKFNIEITDEGAERLTTFGSVIKYLEERGIK
ncbi:MAG: acyl carrier protein [Patescibacteria group bacterium]|nr:acyl carrier protein [Patescibacteria group bacterium]